MSEQWIDQYGQPFADYELRFLEEGPWDDVQKVAYTLGYTLERFAFADVQAVCCTTCGALFKPTMRHLKKHRRSCGWANGASAIGAEVSS